MCVVVVVVVVVGGDATSGKQKSTGTGLVLGSLFTCAAKKNNAPSQQRAKGADSGHAEIDSGPFP